MADEASVRRRKPEPKTTKTPEREPVESQDEEIKKDVSKKSKKKSAQDRLDEDESYSSLYLDIFRVLTFLVLASCGLSYLVSYGESFSWGMPASPKYLKVDWWKKQFVRRPRPRPLHFFSSY